MLSDLASHPKTGEKRLISGNAALVLLPLLQKERDRRANLNTAGFITGYRGSPLGNYDQELWRSREKLEANDIVFRPAVNEDLAATAVWGTQQIDLVEDRKFDGVFAIWYGKGPGVDRSGDPLRHGNLAGTSRHGGVVVVFGDDHPGKSSTVPSQSEQSLSALSIPVFYPANVQEMITHGLYAIALSRFAGVWTSLKCVNETVESSMTVDFDAVEPDILKADEALIPAGGVHLGTRFGPLADEIRLMRHKLPLVHAFGRANAIDRHVMGDAEAKLGIVASGKGYNDVRHALTMLGIDEARALLLRVAVYKVGLIWPLEPVGLTAFSGRKRELLFVEEKRAFLETQAAGILYNYEDRPRIIGKQDESGAPLLPSDVQLEPLDIAIVVAARLKLLGLADESLSARLNELERRRLTAVTPLPGLAVRKPYFCSGCPHNTSTKVPEGSFAMAGIGCHTMAVISMDRETWLPTQMGGEGLNWTGLAPFVATKHVFQNLGDGTYYHSGLMAIRGAVQSGANITYKILFNDAVAMTGGQPIDGPLSVSDIAAQVLCEGVKSVTLLTDDVTKYSGAHLPSGVEVLDRDHLDAVQRRVRDVPGVTVIIYEQTCAAEKRRRRKKKELPDPPLRTFINDDVCEGCGDCSQKSNCISIEPVETELGRKRRIDQSSCNKDFSCIKGFCPSFVTIHDPVVRTGGSPARFISLAENLPTPERRPLDRSLGILVTGIGGTGVVSVSVTLAKAAEFDGYAAATYNMTGLAQKGGAVFSHLRMAPEASDIATAKVGAGDADLIIGCDLMVTASAEAMLSVNPATTTAVVNSGLAASGAFQEDPDIDFEPDRLQRSIAAGLGANALFLDATKLAERALGDAIGANLLMVGYALQKGWLPLSLESVQAAAAKAGGNSEFNLAALAIGRLAACGSLPPEEALDRATRETPLTLDEVIAHRVQHLRLYQDEGYAQAFLEQIKRIRAAEEAIPGARGDLSTAAATSLARLMAYKDEYEVARLYTDGNFARKLADQFSDYSAIKLNLAPPLLTRRDPVTGEPRKIAVGSWVLYPMRLLAKLKSLRGTPFDIFGYTSERRAERADIVHFTKVLDEIATHLVPANLGMAKEIAALPDRIRGFGHVKERNRAAARDLEDDLIARFRAVDDRSLPA